MIMTTIPSSEPSASWSYVDGDGMEITVGLQPPRPTPGSNYCSPYVEDCSDESDNDTPRNIPPDNNELMVPNTTAPESQTEPFSSGNQTKPQVNSDPMDGSNCLSTTQSARANSEPGWREFPLVIVQGKDTTSESSDNRDETLPDAVPDNSIDGNDENETDTISDEVSSPGEPVRGSESKGKGRRVSLVDPPSWDRAYWKYMSQLEEAVTYIERARRTDPQTYREAFEQSSGSFADMELPLVEDTPRINRNRRRSIYT